MAGMAGPHIAIVDDEASVREALGRMLTLSGFTIEIFSSGEEFLGAPLRPGQPDCVVLDYHMPVVSGLDVLRQLGLSGLGIPAIIITGHDRPDVFEQCLSAGAVACISKPLERALLVDTIEAALRARTPGNPRPQATGNVK